MNKKTSGIILIVLGITLIACSWLFFGDIQKTNNQIQKFQEEFYSPIYITDSIVHINITDQACIMLESTLDTLFIRPNNLEYCEFNKETNKLILATHCTSETVDIGNKKMKRFIVKEYNLDTILPYISTNITIKY